MGDGQPWKSNMGDGEGVQVLTWFGVRDVAGVLYPDRRAQM